jgi:ribosome-dependent ATPase
MVTSTFTSSQVAAVFVTAILTIVPTIQFSGLLQPGLDAQGRRRLHRLDLAGLYYMHSSLGPTPRG